MNPGAIRHCYDRARPATIALSIAAALPACAVIDGLTGSSDRDGGGIADANSGADADPRCTPDGPCFHDTVFVDTGLTAISSLALADFDVDGDLDLAVGASDGLRVLFNTDGAGALEPAASFLVYGSAVSSVITADFGSSSTDDIALIDSSIGVRMFVSMDAGDFTEKAAIPGVALDDRLIPIEVDNQGPSEFLLQTLTGSLTLYANDGEGFVAGENPLYQFQSGSFQATVAGDFCDAPGQGFASAGVASAKLKLFCNQDWGGSFYEFHSFDLTFEVAALARLRVPGYSNDGAAVIGRCEPCQHSLLLRVFDDSQPVGAYYHSATTPFATTAVAGGHFVDGESNQGLVLVSDSTDASNPDILVLDQWVGDTFTVHALFSSGLGHATVVTAGDLNGDGISDIVAAVPGGVHDHQIAVILSDHD